jgi:hypothetical protein
MIYFSDDKPQLVDKEVINHIKQMLQVDSSKPEPTNYVKDNIYMICLFSVIILFLLYRCKNKDYLKNNKL